MSYLPLYSRTHSELSTFLLNTMYTQPRARSQETTIAQRSAV